MMTDTPTFPAFDAIASRIDVLGLHSVGFTSAIRGEGASTIAVGTALALATLRRGPVLVVDANWIQPSLTTDAGLAGAPGLADHIAGHIDLDSAIRPASQSGTAFLPIGDRAAARPRLRELTTLLARRDFCATIVDLPAILVGEPFVLPWASLLDRLFVVLREAATPLPLARQAIARVSLATPPDIVLNRGQAQIPRILTRRLPVRA